MDNQTQGQSTSWVGKIKGLFTTKPAAVVPQTPSQVNPENLRVGETYQQWGTRICAIVNGSHGALSPYLQKVFNYIYP